MKTRIGFGYDLHPLGPNRPFFLGGVKIPFPEGPIGHSDGDSLIHALIDALLGALGEGDIGSLFPDNDPAYKNIRSTRLLLTTMERLAARKARIMNIDSVIVAESPLMAPYIPEMKNVLSGILSLPVEDIGIKAKTNEGLGLLGQGRAVAAWVTVLIRRPEIDK